MTTTPSAQPGGQIVASHLTKVYGGQRAVDDLSFTVEPGSITGFLGPNGAGKSTTLRMLLGLSTPTSGTSTVAGRAYADLPDPLAVVGSVLDPAFHPGRTGRDHLRVYCAAAGLPDKRADEVLHLVGLDKAARRKAGGYSLGMRQRPGPATALLGNPRILMLDEPANGLDPEGIQWLRRFLRHLADEGRTILISSHLLQEVEQTVDRVVIIAKGRLVREGTVAELSGSLEQATVVRGPDLSRLAAELERVAPGSVSTAADGLRVRGVPTRRVGELAFATQTLLHELADDKKDLEYLYFQLTAGQGEYETSADPSAGGHRP
ncbi:ABC transporter ATP-binding protein [Blastococcus sp. Marseille-P5729]|uniref:ABC transporter ATP-binding protein n=1 Tax=Blastococcus sp. Marseille-P5729 TaxID=2086582 RepID=UPI000D106C8B|nr:ABC transporter ATP-binding protein [Blastococcus sp. Marseille-P5729]